MPGPTITKNSQRVWLKTLWKLSLKQVQGDRLTYQELVKCTTAMNTTARWHVVAVGKAASSMAAGAWEAWGDSIQSGCVITKDGHGSVPHRNWTFLESSHPVPDRRSLQAGEHVLQLVDSLQQEDRLLFLLSGGASSLLVAPVEGLSLERKAQLGKALLDSGANIQEINCVRKHLSKIKGGGLLQRLAPATGLTLAMSDVAGDLPEVIGSGPTVPDPSTFGQAVQVMKQYRLHRLFPKVMTILYEGVEGKRPETLKLSAAPSELMPFRCLASNRRLLESIQQLAQDDLEVVILDEPMNQPLDVVFLRVIHQINQLQSRKKPLLLLLGGEPTLEVTEQAGKGGRMQHLALRVAGAIFDCPGLYCLAVGSDGTDGPTEAAGALVDGNTLTLGQQVGLDLHEALKSFRSYHYHKSVGTLLTTGYTGTQLGDVVMVLYDPS